MKIALVGGHMAPALSLLREFPKNIQCIYIGRAHVFEGDSGTSLEYQTVRKHGIPFIPLATGRVQRTWTRYTIPSLLKIPQGLKEAYIILKKEKPDVVVGFGGYLSLPVGIAAKLLRIPLVIHESTLEAGLANKLLAPFADKICVSWNSNTPYFPSKKTIITGNPLLPFSAPEGVLPLPESKEKLPFVIVTGGSGGSHSINAVIQQILPELLAIARVVHITGDAKEFGDYAKLMEKTKTLPTNLQKRYSLVKFVNPEYMNALLAHADLVIGRSGVNTVAALLILRKRAILIPLRIGQKDEQLKNAQLMESEGLAMILSQQSLSAKSLFQLIQKNLQQKTLTNRKWTIPIITHGAENLQKEVMQCAHLHRNGK